MIFCCFSNDIRLGLDCLSVLSDVVETSVDFSLFFSFSIFFSFVFSDSVDCVRGCLRRVLDGLVVVF